MFLETESAVIEAEKVKEKAEKEVQEVQKAQDESTVDKVDPCAATQLADVRENNANAVKLLNKYFMVKDYIDRENSNDSDISETKGAYTSGSIVLKVASGEENTNLNIVNGVINVDEIKINTGSGEQTFNNKSIINLTLKGTRDDSTTFSDDIFKLISTKLISTDEELNTLAAKSSLEFYESTNDERFRDIAPGVWVSGMMISRTLSKKDN